MSALDRHNPVEPIIDPLQEAARARAVAQRYYHEFVDLREVKIDHDLFHSIPVDLMFRYNFVPIQAHNGSLEIALADPRNLELIDELAVLLGKKLRVKVATLSQISDLLKKTEQSQRVLEEVTEGFTLDWWWAKRRIPKRRCRSTNWRGGFRYRAGHQAGGYHHLQRA